MNIRVYRSLTAGTRNRSVSSFEECISKSKITSKPVKSLVQFIHTKNGRNNTGKITSRHRGGGHKKLYRQIDFQRTKLNIAGVITAIQYDPNRNARIALVHYKDGEKKYILHPQGLNLGDSISTGLFVSKQIGNTLPLENIPLGTQIHNIELHPRVGTETQNKGGKLVRAAGTSAQILAKEGEFVTLRLPSGEIRFIPKNCWATLGVVGNSQAASIRLGKAGRTRWLGQRPHMRGSAMNAVDHPHGGGEGKAPIGRKKPLTPWGKTALGHKTRSPKKYSHRLIQRSVRG